MDVEIALHNRKKHALDINFDSWKAGADWPGPTRRYEILLLNLLAWLITFRQIFSMHYSISPQLTL